MLLADWLLITEPAIACDVLAGRFRVVDGGNPPTGAAEATVFVRSCPWLRPGLRVLADVAYSGDTVSRCRCPYRAPELTVAAAHLMLDAALLTTSCTFCMRSFCSFFDAAETAAVFAGPSSISASASSAAASEALATRSFHCS